MKVEISNPADLHTCLAFDVRFEVEGTPISDTGEQCETAGLTLGYVHEGQCPTFDWSVSLTYTWDFTEYSAGSRSGVYESC